MTNSDTTVNYFDLLELDPDAPWDQARFEVVLKEKQSLWSRNKVMGASKQKAEAEAAYRLIPAIKVALSDPRQREVHASVARSARNSQAQEKKRDLEERIRLCAARGYLLEEEANQLLKDYAILGEAAVREHWAAIPVRTAPPKAKEPEQIEPSLAAEISRALARVGAESLYEFFLGKATMFSQNVPTTTLHEKASLVRKETNSETKKTAELNDRASLAGHGLQVFSSDEQRARYDATLKKQQFAAVLERAARAVRFTKTLTVSEVQKLIEDASLKGIPPEETRKALITSNFAIEVPSLDSQQLCGCGALSPTGVECCHACGHPLIFPCPKCAKPMPSAIGACTGCGFPIGRRFYVAALIDEVRALLVAHDPLGARDRLLEAKSLWPSPGGDALSTDLGVLSSSATEASVEFERALHEAQRLFESKAYYSSRTNLQSLKHGGNDSRLMGLRAQVEAAIVVVERQVAALPGHSAPADDVAKACMQILEICGDCEAASRRLAQHPPAAPQNLRASVRGRMVALTWSPSPSPDAHYVVVRKGGLRPQHAADGQRVASVRDLRCEDTSAEPGIDINYAVFAERGGVASTVGAHLDLPAMLLADVTNVRARVSDGQVRLDWEPPPNVRCVFIMRTPARSKGAPLQGQRFESVDTRQIVDRSATNEQEYRYTIYCEFIKATGEKVLSPGTDVVATPRENPAGIDGFQIASSGDGSHRELRVSWLRPSKGDVWILISAELPKCSGEAIPMRDLRHHGEAQTTSYPELTLPWQEGSVRYYAPVVVIGETAYVGDAQRYVHLADVRQPEAQNLGDRIRLIWTWPEKCTLAYVNFSGTGWPVDSQERCEPQATRIAISRTEYDLHGSYDLRHSLNGDVYIMVQAVVIAGSETLVAPGARLQVRLRSRVNVEYELRVSGLFRKTVELTISTDHAVDLPPFRVVRKQGLLPKDRDDGECVLRQSGILRVSGRVRLPLTGGKSDGRCFGKLFLESDRDHEWITVFHPDRAKLKI